MKVLFYFYSHFIKKFTYICIRNIHFLLIPWSISKRLEYSKTSELSLANENKINVLCGFSKLLYPFISNGIRKEMFDLEKLRRYIYTMIYY